MVQPRDATRGRNFKSLLSSGDIWKVKVLVAQLCQTLCNPIDCSPLGVSVHGVLQARILEWVAISFSRGSSWPRDRTQVSCIIGRIFTVCATRKALERVAIPFSRISSWSRDGTCISCIAGRLYCLSHQGSPLETCAYIQKGEKKKKLGDSPLPR